MSESWEHVQAGFTNEKFNVANDPQLSLLREFWANIYTHVILTAEADSLPTDEKELLDDCGFVGCHSSRSNDLSVHARIVASGFFSLYGNQMDMQQSLRSSLAKKRQEEQPQNRDRLSSSLTFWSPTEASRERSAEELFADLESVASVVEGSDLGTTEDPVEPTARCTNNTKKRQLVTRSLSPPQGAMKSLAAVRSKQYFNKCVTLRLVSLRKMPMLQRTSTTQIRSTKICTIPQLLPC